MRSFARDGVYQTPCGVLDQTVILDYLESKCHTILTVHSAAFELVGKLRYLRT